MDLTLDSHSAYAFRLAPLPGRPTLLLIHGAGLDSRAWLPTMRRLAARGFGLIAPDLPGHGATGGAALPDIPAMARWVMRCADVPQPVNAGSAMHPAARSGTLLLVGHSMGAMVALHAAGEVGLHAAAGGTPRIAGTALLATAFPLAVSAALLQAAIDDEPGAQAMVNAWSHAMPRAGEGGTPPAQAAAMAANLACIQSQRPGTLHTDLLACNTYAEGFTSAARLRCPALLLLGEKDRMTPPRNAQALAAALLAQTSTRVATLPGTGHNMMGERPDAVADALAEWGEQVSP
ncbi:MAG: alpha/beta hydrolase [Betaproteobacteria bacterium]|nr:alpha/beta hydrolase [Betaproteobacteria bacterium]